ncbi:diguanylate cyclase/phosphodiesterase (GGDEF & EAL domains) with PAS/PAC sensor(s) [hydrothermal vent metagenome]|uniref:Diguanylate cyclase/phosphodiesterase (GGDEF & EAL domains) with PAS/PAC sensor(S) n=1 Tax=hydrothermal vent metagenome TaxID=652676 RepID=A0A1W1CGV9_9ZZZZ
MNYNDNREEINYLKNLKVLFVEDDLNAREITTMILEDIFGNVVSAVDGIDAFEKFQHDSFDIVISDINMPRMNGIELFKKIKEINQDVSLIFLSAHNESNYFLEGIKIGVNGYLLKPINIHQLMNTFIRVAQKYKYKKQAQENLCLLNEYKEAVNQSSIVSKANIKGIITFVNDAFCKISQYTEEELIGKNHNIVRHPDMSKSVFEDLWDTIKNKKKSWKGVIKNRAKNGTAYYTDSLIMPILDNDGNILEYISIRHDITAVMNPAKQLMDAVHSNETILIYIKIAKFEILEEFYDNETLEKIQKNVKNYLFERFQNMNVENIYQLGEGNYGVLLDKKRNNNPQKLFEDIQDVQKTIQDDKIKLDDFEYDIAILVSVVYAGERILESAKMGMKQLLESEKYFIVSNDFAKLRAQKARKNIETLFMIKEAIASSKVISYFQPIIENKTKKIAKYESLVRLIDKNDKVLSPYFFLDTAKKTDYYSKITHIVLEHSFAVLEHCQVDISINLSAIDIEQNETREKIFTLLEKNKHNTSRVVFELLEDETVRDFETIKAFIKNVKEYEVKIAIDDFGTGYSNFERLLDYQPDILKIDGSLIKNIENSDYSLSLVKSIVAFAKEQDIATIAEFIENENIFKIINEIGVDYSQGYFFGKPEPLIEAKH